MNIFYLYNEILPKKKAHDVFIFHECEALAQKDCDVTLLCGLGSYDDDLLHQHYNTKFFKIKRLPIVRKNNPLNLSWNRPFFFFCQRQIEKHKPALVILSVLKQAAYHLERKVRNVKYLYEVHELKHYPTQSGPWKEEKKILEKADVITVTTKALKDILQSPPYNLKVPIEVVPLAVKATQLNSPPKDPFTLMYVGQLYRGQGIEFLIEATRNLPIKVKIIGENKHFQAPHIEFLGFHPPHALSSLTASCHAFVAPFEAQGRMPYVAHTKLCEYIEWARPVIAPKLPVVEEHFPEDKGVIYFEPGNAFSLKEAILQMMAKHERLQEEIATLSGTYKWEKRAEHYKRILCKHQPS